MTNKCFVKGCKSGYDKQNSKKSAFKAPKDPNLRQQWAEAIPRKDIILSSSHVICEDHFLASDIEKTYKTKMPDGSVHEIDRGKAKLRSGAVPCIFPELPLNKLLKRRKKPIQKKETKQKKAVQPTSSDEIINVTDEILNIIDDSNSHTYEDNEMNELFNKLFGSIKNATLDCFFLPSEKWTATYIPFSNQIVLAEWEIDCSIIKKFIINKDLSVEVFFGRVKIEKSLKTKISNLFELKEMLNYVHKLRVCENIFLMKSRSLDCEGFLPIRVPKTQGLLKKICLSCYKEKIAEDD